MTKTEIIAEARRLSRVTVSGVITDDVELYVDNAFEQFSRDVHGIEAKDYLSLDAYFMPRVTQAFKLTIVGSTNNEIDSDIQVGTSVSEYTTGDDMATNLQVAIRAVIDAATGGTSDLTVVWADFYFTIDGIDSTSMVITSPSTSTAYYDATTDLFGGGLTGTTSLTGGFPQWCTVEADLSGEAISVHRVQWGTIVLLESETPEDFMDPMDVGDPTTYMIFNQKIRLSPVPTTLDRFYIEYKKYIDTSDDAVSVDQTDIPESFQKAICYYTASELLTGMFEDTLAEKRMDKYKEFVKQYIMWKANQNTNVQIAGRSRLWYKVEV